MEIARRHLMKAALAAQHRLRLARPRSRKSPRSLSRNGSRRFRAQGACQGHIGRDLHARDGRPEARHQRVHRNPQPAGVQPAALAIHQSPRFRLAHPDRPGASEDYAPLLARIEKDFGVERSVILGLWGIESTFGDPLVKQNHSRPVFPALAALAWGEPRRRAYWETELINALRIVEKGWSTRRRWSARGRARWGTPNGCRKSGSMSASTMTATARSIRSASPTMRSGAARAIWSIAANTGAANTGATRCAPPGADRTRLRAAMRRGRRWGSRAPTASRFRNPNLTAKLWVPVAGGPAFLLGPNFYAIKSYNPSMNYVLAIVHLGDRVLGAGPFVQPFPGSERAPTLAEVQEMQKRLTAAGYDTGGTDGRVGNLTMLAARNFQQKAGLVPADGYLGLKLLAKLRGG